MTSTTAAPADVTPAAQRHRFAQRGLRSALLGIAIGLVLTIATGNGLVPNLVQSICIAMGCWLTIDLLRVPLARWHHRHDAPGSSEALSRWPGWPLMIVAIVVGTVIGFSAGNAIANLLLDRGAALAYYRGNGRQILALLLFSLVPGTVVTYWFYSRETIAGKEAAIQTAQRQAAEHRLKLIESQLEPHMLFNTLATLRVLIGTDPARAQAMLDQLIAFLRATLAGSRAAQHPLRDEFARLGDYLALMQLRMGARLQTRFELPEALAALPVPPLLLQPLVENSIKHGLEPAIAGGRIEISAVRDGDTLVLRVRDTGLGLADAAGSPGRGVTDADSGFGVAQVRERLATVYGAQATLTLAAAGDADGGTLATVRLPIDPTASETPAR